MRRVGHVVQAVVLAALAALVVRLPYARALTLGRALGRTLLACGLRRRVALDNLRLAFPDWDEARLERTARACYETWGQVIVDYLRIPRLAEAAAWSEVMDTPTGIEHVAAARRAGKGVILLSAHFGAFEFLGAAAAAAGHPVHFLVQRQSNRWLERQLDARRRLLGVGVIGRGSALREALRALAANGCVAMVADQDARSRGVFVDFLGQPSSTPVGAAALSLRTGAPIVMGFTVRGADGRHRGFGLPPIDFTPSGDFARDVAALTQRHAAILEVWVRRYPEHWYWLHRRWKTRPERGERAGAGRALGQAVGPAAVALAVALTLAPAGSSGPVGASVAGVGRAAVTVGAGAEEPTAGRGAEATTFGGAGSSLLPLAQTRVARVVEDLVVRRDADGWVVEAVDVFEAGAAAELVPVGLPDFQAVADSGGARPTLSEVRLLVDGVEVRPTIEPPPAAKDLPGLGGIDRLFVWRLRFEPEERRVCRVRFRVRSSRTEGGEELLFYYLNTGTPWRGPSGRINARFELGGLSSEDLVAGWLRPTRFGTAESSVTWLLAAEEPEDDLVLALREPRDPLAEFADRERGPLALSRSESEDWLARGTPREWRFWRAHLRARLGETPADSTLRARLGAEPWFRPRPPGRLRKASKEEDALLASLERRLAEWEGHRIPEPPDPGGR